MHFFCFIRTQTPTNLDPTTNLASGRWKKRRWVASQFQNYVFVAELAQRVTNTFLARRLKSFMSLGTPDESMGHSSHKYMQEKWTLCVCGPN